MNPFNLAGQSAVTPTEVLDWEPVSAPIYDRVGNRIPHYQAITKGDRVLAVKSDRYQIFTNHELREFVDIIIGNSDRELVGFGEFNQSKVVYGLIDFGINDFGIGDNHRTHLLILNSFDGSFSLTAFFVSTRLFCTNQFTMLVRKHSEMALKLKHFNSNLQLFEGLALDYVTNYDTVSQAFAESVQRMTKIKLPIDSAKLILETRIFPLPQRQVRQSVLDARATSIDQILQMAYHGMARGSGLLGFTGTKYGFFNSVVEFLDYQGPKRRATVQSLVSSNTIGPRAVLKQKVYELLTEDV